MQDFDIKKFRSTILPKHGKAALIKTENSTFLKIGLSNFIEQYNGEDILYDISYYKEYFDRQLKEYTSWQSVVSYSNWIITYEIFAADVVTITPQFGRIKNIDLWAQEYRNTHNILDYQKNTIRNVINIIFRTKHDALVFRLKYS